MPTESKSETPRTDKFESDNESALKNGFNDYPSFARQLEKELNEAKRELELISLNLCGVEIGKPLEGIDEPETDLSMVYSFVEGEIDKQAYLKDKYEQERNTLAKELAEANKRLDCNVESMKGYAKENKVMREALEQCHPAKVWDMARGFYSHNVGASCANHKENCKLVDAALKGHDTTNLIVLTRDELISEIEKMPCVCHEGFHFSRGGLCHRCKWIAELKAGGA